MAVHTTLGSLFTDIANAIRAKTGTQTLMVADAFPTAISNLIIATGNAADNNVLAGKTYSNSTGPSTGTMTNNGGVTGIISTKNQSVSIASGYHDGTGTVSISSVEQDKIIASNIKKDVQILGITGTYEGGGIIPTGNINITNTESTNVYNYATAQVVDADLIPGNIRKDVDILGVVGIYEGTGSTMTKTLNAAGGYTATITG